MLINTTSLHIPVRDRSIHCIVTSPPYFGKRTYKGKQDFLWPSGKYAPCTGTPECIQAEEWHGGYGSEPTPELYIWHSLLVLRECYRVLRDDGVLWWNLGDTAHTTPPGKRGAASLPNSGDGLYYRKLDSQLGHDEEVEDIYKDIPALELGQLIGIPQRLMLAAQADGWVIRNDCVWSKVAPMPESIRGQRWVRHKIKVRSVWNEDNPHPSKTGGINYNPHNNHAEWKDCPGCAKCLPNDGLVLRRGSWRHTRAHEYVFQMTKGMSYWNDGEIVREKVTESTIKRYQSGWNGNTDRDWSGDGPQNHIDRFANDEESKQKSIQSGRNPRSVFTPRSNSYSGAHYATYPPELIAPLMLSSTPRKCCPICGEGWSPILNQSHVVTGYKQSCTCPPHNPIPGICLDPFVGSGTTLEVAREIGVRAIGLDISFEYLQRQAKSRGMGLTSNVLIDELPLFKSLNNSDS